MFVEAKTLASLSRCGASFDTLVQLQLANNAAAHMLFSTSPYANQSSKTRVAPRRPCRQSEQETRPRRRRALLRGTSPGPGEVHELKSAETKTCY